MPPRTLHLRTAADVDRLPPALRAQIIATKRAERGPRVLHPAWDAESRQVAALTAAEWAAELRHAGERDRKRWRRMRWRWHRSEFMEAVVRPHVEPVGGWAPDNDMLSELYDSDSTPWRERQGSPGMPSPPEQLLLWASRGSAKTTGLRGIVLHSALHVLETGILVICNDKNVAGPWCETVGAWAKNLPPIAAEVYSEVSVRSSSKLVVICVDGVEVAIHPRGWGSGSIRGVNHNGIRPSLGIADDVESIRNQSSERVRETSAARMNGEVMGVFPLSGGGRFWMLATPMDRNCYSAQVVRGEDDALAGWSYSRHPAVRRWPVEKALWEQCRAIFRDVDGAVLDLQARGEKVTRRETRKEQVRRAAAFHAAHAAQMDAGAEVLDPVRLPILACYVLLWSIGPLAFGLEYMVDPTTKAPDATFDSSAWVRVEVSAGKVVTRSATYHLDQLRAVAYYDPSDGGDMGAVAVGVKLPDGRAVLLHASEMSGRMPVQMPLVVAACDAWSADLTAEPNMMHDSERQQLAKLWEVMNRARTNAGKRALVLRFKATTEEKDLRIRSADQPLATGRLMVSTAVGPALGERADAWRPGGRSVDDILDAMQRVAEMTGVIIKPSDMIHAVRGVAL